MKINYKVYKNAPELMEIKFNDKVVYSTLGDYKNLLGERLSKKISSNAYNIYKSKNKVSLIRKILFHSDFHIGKTIKFDLVNNKGEKFTFNVLNNSIGVKCTKALGLVAKKAYI